MQIFCLYFGSVYSLLMRLNHLEIAEVDGVNGFRQLCLLLSIPSYKDKSNIVSLKPFVTDVFKKLREYLFLCKI